MSEKTKTAENPQQTESGAAQGTLDKAKIAVEQGVAAAREKAQDVGAEVRGRAVRVGEAAREGFGTAKVKIGEGYEKARKDVDQLATDVSRYVRDNPGRSVLVAAGLGFFVGLMVRGSRRR